MSITIKELSELTGIPRVTISRALNNYPHVSAQMKKRVLEAVERHGYEPNLMATSLVNKRSCVIAVIVPDLSAFYAGIEDLITQESAKQGMNVLGFSSYGDPEREAYNIRLAARLQADVLIVAPLTIAGRPHNEALLDSLHKPVVYLDSYHSSTHSSVFMDNVLAGRMAADYLMEWEHQRIAILGTGEDPDNKIAVGRVNGCIERLRECGVPFEDEQLLMDTGAGNCFLNGYQLTKRSIPFLCRKRITALYTFADPLALGAMRALREAGYRLPEDMSIISVDNVDYSEYLSPPLTTIAQPMVEMAKKVVAAALNPDKRVQCMLPPTLIERASCTRPA